MDELRQYLRVVRKWLWLVILAVLVAGASSYVASKDAPPIYRTKTTLMVGQSISNPDPTTTDLWTGQQLAYTYAQMVQREPVLKGAIERLGLDVDWRGIAGQVSASQVAQTQLLEISVVDTNPYRAKALADAIAQQLILLSPSSASGLSGQEQAFIQDQLADLRGKIEQANGEIEKLQQELDAAISARQIQDLQNQIGVLQGKVTNWQNTYAQLLTSLQGGEVNTLSVVEEAALPTSPIGPNVRMNVLLAAAIGFILAVGGAFVIEYIDDTIKTPEDVARVTDLPTLATIARIEGKEYPEKLVARRHPLSPITEAYRVLRTNIQFASVDSPLRTILVTSPGPTEGKSISLANLAVVLAQSGLRVAAIDTDLRRPVLHKIFDVTNNHGLCDAILRPSLNGVDLLQETGLSNLYLLPTGALPPNPAELLGSERMRTLIDGLLEHVDMVLLDSPPALVVADATILATRVDGVLLIYDAGRTRRQMAQKCIEEMRRARANLLGVVLNQVSPRQGSYAYNYYYYYYYTADGDRRKRRRRSRSLLGRFLPSLDPSDGRGPQTTSKREADRAPTTRDHHPHG